MNFDSLGLNNKILQAVKAQGYDKPSPIQQQAIPSVLQGKDVMAAAQTGTGKTAGFTLPILQLLSSGSLAKPNQVRTLVLTPTRELAIQVAESVATYGKNLPLRSAVVYGGVKINPQMMKLRKGVDILVATPGRLLDLYSQNAVKFDHLEILVLDEADRMLDMGFIRDIKKIIALLPNKRQNLMFSATFSNDIRALAKGLVNNPVEISVSPRNTTVESVKQLVIPVDKKRKTALLSFLIGSNNWQQVLVFSRTKHGANRLTKHLIADGIKSLAIHGNKSQGARVKALTQFKNNEIQVLVATDIAARGIDIDQLPHVVNFDLPNVPEDYVHRIGRTGRAGKSGEAVSLVSADESKQLSGIERLIQKQIERKLIDGFEPSHDVPDSKTVLKPMKPRKPKRHKPQHERTNKNESSGDSNSRANSSQKRRKRKPNPQNRNTNQVK
ncbi:MAG: DEAD/DEAH box helicase [Kangiellaceae bacterium]|nr:DEAD/DEAH box helicase [Kangiellaceae bacterium]